MAIDLTGGIDPEREYMFAERPENPEMRDSVSFWVVDDRGEVGLPRIGVEAVASNWEAHGVQVNVAFADGRVYRLRDEGASLPPTGPDGRATVLGAGPLVFTCVEPFNVWTMTFDGQADATSSSNLIEGRKDGPRVDLRFQVEAKMAVPPWVQGALQADADSQLKTSIVGDLMGGPRYEQLFQATGSVHVADEHHAFIGSGLRIRRQGVRRLEGFWGHCWQSALFPSGRAFGYIAYPPRPDGEPAFNEGYLFMGDAAGDGELIPARAVQAPWLTRLEPKGEDVSVVLETDRGTVRIEGETVVSTHDITDPGEVPAEMLEKMANWTFPALQQAGVRYRWDGEETIGMLERSSPMDKVTR
jgi:prepilin-type processing-associated H-X9-DG protein